MRTVVRRFGTAALLAALLIPLPASAGVDEDGDADIVIAALSEPNRVCLGAETVVFDCTNVSSDMGRTWDVALGDVDNDGDLDAVFANDLVSNRNQVCLGDGVGGFACHDIGDAHQSVGVALGDVDQDGNVDAVFANYGTADSEVCLGNGNGAFFCDPIGVEPAGQDVALGDVDGNGTLDAVFANSNIVTGFTDNRLCRGDGNGVFTCSGIGEGTYNSFGLDLADIDNDGDLDAVFAAFDDPSRVCLGTGTGAFFCADLAPPRQTRGIAIGDFDGDGAMDVALGNDSGAGAPNQVCWGAGNGTFTCSDAGTAIDPTQDVTAGDVNRDGIDDVLFLNDGQPDELCLGDGSRSLDCRDLTADTTRSFGAAIAPPISDTVGLVDVSSGVWHLRNESGVVTSFFYGNPGDLPIAGDWDGDGDSTPGLYRQSDGFFYSRNSNTQGPADAECFAGNPEDIPVVGDWDGDGDDNLGIYRPSEQRFYLFTTTCVGSPMGAAQIGLLFGNPGDKPVAGDFDGDGIDEVGLHRESTGFFYWRNTLDTGIADGEIFFGDPGDRFVSGDFGVVDGTDTPAVFRPSNQTFFFRHTLTQGVADSQFTWAGAGPGWLPVSGTFGLD
jgi:hypothetical protein